MTMNRRSLLQRSVVSALASSLGLPALAQGGNAFIISGFPAGGMGDFVARPLAEKLRGKYAPNVLVESKVGAGGRIAVEYVKRAATYLVARLEGTYDPVKSNTQATQFRGG